MSSTNRHGSARPERNVPVVPATLQKPDACNAAGFKCTVRDILSGLVARFSPSSRVIS